MHCLLKECFGDFYTNEIPAGIAPQPFRLVATRGASVGCLYGYTRVDADELREMAGVCACPLQEQVMPPSSLVSKPMPTEWRVGLRLGFEARVRPVVRLRRDPGRVSAERLRRFRTRPEEPGEPRPGKECDVFQWEALVSSATLGMGQSGAGGAGQSGAGGAGQSGGGWNDTDPRAGVRRLARQAVRAARRRAAGQGQDEAGVVPAHAGGAKAAQALQRRAGRSDARGT